MARKPRFGLPGVPQHIIQRGNNRAPCFYGVDDYQRYLHDLQEAAHRNQCAIHAYVLMTNHAHLLATPATEHAMSHMMQDIGRHYVRYINDRYQRTGTLWEGRYKASLVDSETYLFTCMRYIELNPVRVEMVSHPGDYQWSSYTHNATGSPNTLITSHPRYSALGCDPQQRQSAYRELFRYHVDETQLQRIRSAANQELVLGREDFKEKIERMTQRQTRPGQRGRPRIEEMGAIYYVF